MKKKIQVIITLGPSSLNGKFLKFSNNNIDLLRLNMSHIEPEELEEKIKFIRKFTNTNICVDTEGAQIRTKVSRPRDLKKNQNLIISRVKDKKLLSLYHPALNRIYKELKPQKIAEDDLDVLENEIKALTTAQSIDVDHAEAILRTELGDKVSTMTSKELKRDLLLFARSNPELFLELATDENINIRNIGIKAVENGIIVLSNDQRTFKWASNDRKLITVPFDENPYSALAVYFKTDEGIEVFQTIEKKLK